MAQLSIIIPAYNQGRYITATLESALAQTHPQVEVIVVNDGSTDDTAERIAPYAGRIQIIQQANRGLSGARNTGYAASIGDYVLFLDSDDLLQPTALQQMSRVLDEEPAHGLVYCAWQQIHADTGATLGEVHPGYSGRVVKELLLRRFFFFGSSALIRRRALDQVGPFDESLLWGDDADMWLRLGLAGRTFGYVDSPLLHYRVHPASMTASVGAHQVEGWQAGLRKFFSRADLPTDLRRLERQAYAILYLETAGRYFRAGDNANGTRMLELTHEANGLPEADSFLNWLAGTALDPRTTDPQILINRVFNHLPPGMESLQRLRRRAEGRYFTAALFSAWLAGDSATVRRYLWPAFRLEPRNLTNRGLLKIAALAALRQGR